MCDPFLRLSSIDDISGARNRVRCSATITAKRASRYLRIVLNQWVKVEKVRCQSRSLHSTVKKNRGANGSNKRSRAIELFMHHGDRSVANLLADQSVADRRRLSRRKHSTMRPNFKLRIRYTNVVNFPFDK
jgi:hypothetical protein